MTDAANLSSWLAGRSADQLAAVLQRRSDSHWGAPLRGLDDLAARLARPASVVTAIGQLPLPGFELLHTLAALGPLPTVAGAADLLDSGARSPQEQRKAVRIALAWLESSALAWPDDRDTIAVNPGVRVVIDQPLGIGRTLAIHLEQTPVDQLRQLVHTLGLPATARRADAVAALTGYLTDHRLVQELLSTAPDRALARLHVLARGEGAEHGYLPRNQQDREGENWARRRGLLFGGQYYAAEVPVEVALAVRRDEITVSFHPSAPELSGRPVTEPAVDTAAAAAAGEFTETVAALLDLMGRTPLAALKAGGIGTREVARVAKTMGLPEGLVRLDLELIRSLGLLADVGDGVGTGPAAVTWRGDEPSVRFADLAVAWCLLPVTPSLTHDSEGKAIPAIGGRFADGAAMTLRWSVMDTMGSLPPGSGLASIESLTEHLSWWLPGLIEPEDPAIAAIWTEAHALGVLAQGALTPLGAALVRHDPVALLTVAGSLLAPASSVGRFGSDLTVMVAGSPAAAVSALLDSCADRESRGAAVVWRFSPTSVRRALDEGVEADELVGALRSIAETDLPQPLTYLIGDVQRRHGSLVVHPALCCVRSADEALLIEVAAHRSLRALRPSLLAPTVIAFQGEPSVVLGALRAAGYMPVPVAVDGAIELGGVEPTEDEHESAEHMVDRLRALGSRPISGRNADPGPALLELAAAILSTTRLGPVTQERDPSSAEATIEAHGAHLDPVERRQLAFAVDNQVPVQITYRSGSGGVTTRTISDIELVGDLMYAWCHLRDDERAFAVGRVQAVLPVDA